MVRRTAWASMPAVVVWRRQGVVTPAMVLLSCILLAEGMTGSPPAQNAILIKHALRWRGHINVTCTSQLPLGVSFGIAARRRLPMSAVHGLSGPRVRHVRHARHPNGRFVHDAGASLRALQQTGVPLPPSLPDPSGVGSKSSTLVAHIRNA